MADFITAYRIVKGEEGTLSTDRTDPGNWTGGRVGVGVFKGTKFGISAAAFPDLDIVNLTLEQARDIFRAQYWDANRCGEMPWAWGLGVFDCDVNQGDVIGARLAQEALGLKVDGHVGALTLNAMQHASEEQFDLFMAERQVRYTQSSIFSTNGKGWFKRCLQIHHLALSPPPVSAS